MAFRVQQSVAWQAGPSSPVKYAFSIDAMARVEDIIDEHTAVISLIGNVTVSNHPTNSRNSWAASDFAVLTPGDVDVASHPFVYGTSYYQQTIPFLPAPYNTDQDRMLVQFRGDTWRSDPSNSNNRVSLWTKYGGLVANQLDSENTWTYPINISFEIPVPTTGNAPVLAWISSGADDSTHYDWLGKYVWATWFDLTWEAKINYDMNGGTGSPSAQAERVLDTQTSVSFIIPDTAPTWGDYIFLGWSTVRHTESCLPSDVEYVAGDTFTVQKSDPTKVLYAVWMKDYRPGEILTSGEWKSANRTDGKCHILQNGSWVEMRTIDGGSGEGNPPSRRTSGVWKNQYKIGSY